MIVFNACYWITAQEILENQITICLYIVQSYRNVNQVSFLWRDDGNGRQLSSQHTYFNFVFETVMFYGFTSLCCYERSPFIFLEHFHQGCTKIECCTLRNPNINNSVWFKTRICSQNVSETSKSVSDLIFKCILFRNLVF